MLQIDGQVSETLLISLYMRYLESKAANPIIHDPSALQLVPQLDYDFSKLDKAIHSQVGTALRARYFDDLTRAFIAQNPQPVVIQLACGLDHRAARLGDTSTPFVLLDLPEVIELRRRLLPPQVNETLISASAFDKDWIEPLRAQFPNHQFIIVIEGLVMYFPKEQLRTLLVHLAQGFPAGTEIAFDVTGSLAIKMNGHHDAVKYSRATFQLACDDDREMEGWAPNLQFLEVKTYTDFPEFRRAGWLGFHIMRLIRPLRRAFRLLHYRIN